jgi:DNA polymerase-4
VGAATILHADLDAFYAAVAVRDRPQLRGRPVAVGGGVILSCTYEARSFGVEGGMALREARRLCPHLVVVPGSFPEYVAESRRVFAIFERFTPWVEPLSIDEAFLDVSGARRLFGEPVTIAGELRSAVALETGLAVSVGVARTKFLAKVASRLAKPDGILAVSPEGELEFLHSLPVDALWGVGPVVTRRLAAYGIATVGELAHVPVRSVSRWLGPGRAHHLAALAWNLDPRAVDPRRRARSVGAQRTFATRSRDRERQAAVLLELADRVGRRMRSAGRCGRRVTVRIRFADFETITRSTTLGAPTAATDVIYRAARRLAAPAADDVRGLRLLGISVSEISACGHLQLALPFDDSPDVLRPGSPAAEDRLTLDSTVDRLRDRFGREAVRRAAVMHSPEKATLRELTDPS